MFFAISINDLSNSRYTYVYISRYTHISNKKLRLIQLCNPPVNENRLTNGFYGTFSHSTNKVPVCFSIQRFWQSHISGQKVVLHTLFQLLLHILLLFKINHVAAFIINLHISNYIYYMKINERIKKVYRGFSRYADSLKFLQIEVSF